MEWYESLHVITLLTIIPIFYRAFSQFRGLPNQYVKHCETSICTKLNVMELKSMWIKDFRPRGMLLANPRPSSWHQWIYSSGYGDGKLSFSSDACRKKLENMTGVDSINKGVGGRGNFILLWYKIPWGFNWNKWFV